MESCPSMTVYSASAGAGKTFTLALRYIELLIENPYSYKETLAVTFTNKATEEMKLRIMSELYGLANNLSGSDGYLQRIKSDLELDEKIIRDRSKLALQLILHDFSHFAVETIDAFFQRVLRNLARELELNANLRLELNDGEVEEIAVDNLVADLTRGNEVLEWILNYIHQQMDEDKSADVIKNIKNFGQKIFSEPYKENAKELNACLSNQAFFNDFIKRMRDMSDTDEAVQKLSKYADRFFEMLEQKGYSQNDFIGKSKSACSYFEKLRNGKILDADKVLTKAIIAAMDGPEGWTKESPDSAIYTFAKETLVPYINEVECERQQIQRIILSSKEIKNHLNDLRLLNIIEQKVREMNEENGRFLLSDTQSFLAALMREEDAPFVYEKIGSRLKNIMIDEFQDTSTIQWKNFRKLLLNTLSDGGSKSLIVGDVKQSIYRWRNGDWSLLHNIDNDKDICRHSYVRIALKQNWRSEERIINFNNDFFEQAAQVFRNTLEEDGNKEASLVTDIYDSRFMKQEVPAAKKQRAGYTERGLINITLLSAADKNNSEVYMERTAEIIEQLFSAGAKDRDIAILVRDNKRISEMADYLQTQFPNHRFISDEAYRLDASSAISIIITAMRSLLNNDDKLLKAQLALMYQKHSLGKEVDITMFDDDANIDALLPAGFITDRQRIAAMPLTDLTEEIIKLFALNNITDEASYIYAFHDQLDAFAQKNIPDMGLFIERWDENIHEKTIKNGDLEGVTIITIHKSKGLEYNHVIIPFCNWELVHRGGEILWCRTDEEPFNEIPIIPVNFINLKNTVYSADYQHERLQNSIDNLNILYVAFTRASQNLFVIGQNCIDKYGKTGNSNISAYIQKTLQKLCNPLNGYIISGDEKKQDELNYSIGELCIKEKKVETSDNIFLKHGISHEVGMLPSDINIEFRQSNASRKFVASNTEEQENNENDYIQMGTMMHDVLSRITTAKDIDRVLKDLEQNGLISQHDKTMNAQKMSDFLRKRLTENNHQEVREWFDDSMKVMNECTIVYKDERMGICHEKRPDRVVMRDGVMTVIDFKFGNPSPAHIAQVKGYIDLLGKISHSTPIKEIKGYLWYVYQNEIKEVKA